MVSRSEHLDWCKQRANKMLYDGDINGAFSSFTSDMMKHPETANHLGLELGMALCLSGNLSTVTQMRQWINGFN